MPCLGVVTVSAKMFWNHQLAQINLKWLITQLCTCSSKHYSTINRLHCFAGHKRKRTSLPTVRYNRTEIPVAICHNAVLFKVFLYDALWHKWLGILGLGLGFRVNYLALRFAYIALALVVLALNLDLSYTATLGALVILILYILVFISGFYLFYL